MAQEAKRLTLGAATYLFARNAIRKAFDEEENDDITDTKTKVISARFIGANGIGKTERTISELKKYLLEYGYNPVMYKDGIEPQSDKDVLIHHLNCSGGDDGFFRGIPYGYQYKDTVLDEDGNKLLDSNGEPVYVEKTGLATSGRKDLNTAAKFAFSAFIFDEANRLRPSGMNYLGGLMAGEKMDGNMLARKGSIVIITENDTDDLNNVNVADYALITKGQTFKLRPDVSEFLAYAAQKDLHPAVRVFASQNREIFENFKAGPIDNEAVPTFRRLTDFSKDLYLLEKDVKEGVLQLDLYTAVETLAQSQLGFHQDTQIPVPEMFARLYIDEIGAVKPIVDSIFKETTKKAGLPEQFDLASDVLYRTERFKKHLNPDTIQKIENRSPLENASAATRIESLTLYIAKELNAILKDKKRFWIPTATKFDKTVAAYNDLEARFAALSSAELTALETDLKNKHGIHVSLQTPERRDAAARALASSKKLGEVFPDIKQKESKALTGEESFRSYADDLKNKNKYAESLVKTHMDALFGKAVNALAVFPPSEHAVFVETLSQYGEAWKSNANLKELSELLPKEWVESSKGILHQAYQVSCAKIRARYQALQDSGVDAGFAGDIVENMRLQSSVFQDNGDLDTTDEQRNKIEFGM